MKPTSVWGRVSFGGALRPAFQSLLFSDESAKEMLAHYKYKCHKPRTNVPWRGCVRWLCHISSKGFVWLPTVTSSNKLQISSSKKKVMRGTDVKGGVTKLLISSQGGFYTKKAQGSSWSFGWTAFCGGFLIKVQIEIYFQAPQISSR